MGCKGEARIEEPVTRATQMGSESGQALLIKAPMKLPKTLPTSHLSIMKV